MNGDTKTGTLDVHGAGQLDKGLLDILQVGRGHLRLTIGENDPVELDRARRLIEDMLRRGFAIFVEEADGKATRVKAFDPARMVYIVGDGPDDDVAAETAPPGAIPTDAPTQFRRGKKGREVPVAAATATAVGRTAGG